MGVQALCLLQESSGGSLAEKAVAAAEALKARTEEAAERARESLMGAAGTARVGGQLATGTSKGTVAAQQAQATAAEGGTRLSRPWRRTQRGSPACTANIRKPLRGPSRGPHSPPYRPALWPSFVVVQSVMMPGPLLAALVINSLFTFQLPNSPTSRLKCSYK